MGRWFFEGFEKCIECSCREHMDLIDDIDFILSLIRLESGLFDEVTDIFDTIIARSIDLDTVEHRPCIECYTIRTCMTRIPILEIRTIDSLSEDTGTRRLSRSSRSMQEVGMIDSIRPETISQNRRDVVLSDDTVPVMGSIGGIERHFVVVEL